MVDFTSSVYQFRQAVAQGDYYQALGVTEGARKLDIDVAAAHLADRWPVIASQVSAVANVLTNQDRRAVYGVTRGFRDHIHNTLGQRYGADIFEAVPDCRRVLWHQCCALLRFDLDNSQLLVGPKGADSLAKRGGDWIVETVLASGLLPLDCRGSECMAGSVTRELWYADCPVCRSTCRVFCKRIKREVERGAEEDTQGATPPREFKPGRYQYQRTSCPNCRAEGVDPTEYDDTYTFELSKRDSSGGFVRGQGRRTGRAVFAILNGVAKSSPPTWLLERFYSQQQEGKDVTLKELEAQAAKTRPNIQVAPPRQTTTTDSGKAGWAVGWIALAIVIAIVRGAGHLSDRSTNRRQNTWEPPEFKMPSTDFLSGFQEPQNLINTEDTLRDVLKSMNKTWTVELDEESKRANEEAERCEDEGDRLGEAGRHREALSEYECARRILDVLVDQHPKNILLQRRLGGVYYSLGLAHSNVNERKESLESYKVAIHVCKQLVDSVYGSGNDYHRLGGAHCNLANELCNDGRRNEAKSHYDAAITVLQKHLDQASKCETATQYLGITFGGRARNSARMKCWQDAIADYTKAIEVDSENADIFRQRGIAYAEMAQWQDAADDFVRSTDLSPMSWRTWYYRALVQVAAEDNEAYRVTCQQMLNNFGHTTDTHTANAIAWTVAIAPDATDDYRPFIELAKRAITSKPEEPLILNTFAAVLCRAGDHQLALDQLRKASELEGSGGSLYNWLLLSAVNHYLGQSNQAKHWLDRVTERIEEEQPQEGSDTRIPPSWNQKLELKLLRQETESLILVSIDTDS